MSGVPFHQDGSRRAFVQDPADLAVVEVRARVGQTVLVRFIHAGYEVLNILIPPGLEVVVIEDTGRQLGGERSPYSRPFAMPVDINAPRVLPITPARRNTAVVRLANGQPPGRYVFEGIFRHLVTGQVLGSVFPAIVFE